MRDEIAMSCARCGHIRGALESEKKCGHCGLDPARWNTAPVEDWEDVTAPGGYIEPPVPHSETPHGAEPAELFATSPAGTDPGDVNPELKVRR
jgi:hypothetical protein